MKELLNKYKSGDIGLEQVLNKTHLFNLKACENSLLVPTKFYYFDFIYNDSIITGTGSTIKESVINALEQVV